MGRRGKETKLLHAISINLPNGDILTYKCNAKELLVSTKKSIEAEIKENFDPFLKNENPIICEQRKKITKFPSYLKQKKQEKTLKNTEKIDFDLYDVQKCQKINAYKDELSVWFFDSLENENWECWN